MGKFTKAESNFLQGIVHGLTLDRFSDSEIVQYLKDHHNISIERSTVHKIRKRIEKEGKTWYEQLRQSDYKYIYTYKERIDSLNRYQRKLNEIINKEESSDFIRIQAIKELHKIEITMAKLYGNLSNGFLSINNNNDFSILDSSTTAELATNAEESGEPKVF
ncbi:MAG: hypothetical protein ACR2F1_13935 [Nitrososphaeraceae archaeon]